MSQTRGRGRRADALSKDVVVRAAVDLLDEHGERGFTFKLLTERLQTGAGAVYWHVANKDELVLLATDKVIGDALAALRPEPGADAETRLRTLLLTMYDALDQHFWAAPHVVAGSAMPNAMLLLERVGSLIAETALPARRHFAAATALFLYLVGVTAQDSAHAKTVEPGVSRDELLGQEAARWAALDPATFPFVTRVAAELGDHSDRDQFITGVDLFLDGLRAHG
ncbi:TetR family transcriptional regulator [Actinoplanes cyaneus]|uniref:TetR family transcriptional regulator n=1 Tax=Actinoplanes cyaneus TaxID=52696 RepID=A0A919M9K8_9ACTN|nr:TetR family transcriptional regulator [Actinoplanes cyaneus]MCW2143002.1 transcriptional regulator, TetR family [Actinoplanes cyaneus]GID69563.1 TetR family transcriptional regulator [Actinoplanes cyaneus]